MITMNEAIEMQDDLRAFWRSPRAIAYCRGMLESRVQHGLGTAANHIEGHGPALMARNHGRLIEQASLYWVKTHMVQLCDHAAATMPDQV